MKSAPSLRLELQQLAPALMTPEGRERLAEFIVRGNGKVYSREEIKIRIQKVTRRIVQKVAA